KTFNLGDGHSFDAKLCESFFDLFELERFNDGLQFFHVAVTLTSRGAFQSKANRSTRSHSNCPTRMQSRIFLANQMRQERLILDGVHADQSPLAVVSPLPSQRERGG